MVADGHLVGVFTQLGFIHSDTRRPCRVPDWFLKLVADKWTEE